MSTNTIAAIASPIGSGGIGIIKLSGHDALKIGASIFRRSKYSSSQPVADFKSHVLYHGFIIDPDSGHTIDEVLFVYMKAPHTHTREDIVEIHSHSGPLVVETILQISLSKGAALAEPGEFTKRAFLNNRIDLTQAEAVIDIINAMNERSIKMASLQIKGGFKDILEMLISRLKHIYALLQAGIDFPDEHDVEENAHTDFIESELDNTILPQLKQLVQNYNDGHIYRDGINMVIAGRPNVGKSSLLNKLMRQERAIVTQYPGTTRDTIEEKFCIRGIPVTVIDTAGIRDSDNPVEIIGISRAFESIGRSDFVLFLIDSSIGITFEDLAVFDKINHKKLIIVYNKMDKLNECLNDQVPAQWIDLPSIKISALNDTGIEDLKDMVKAQIVTGSRSFSENIVPNLRQKDLLEKGIISIENFYQGLRDQIPVECNVIELDEALESLNEILGNNIKIDILDDIFSRFCIGK